MLYIYDISRLRVKSVRTCYFFKLVLHCVFLSNEFWPPPGFNIFTLFLRNVRSKIFLASGTFSDGRLFKVLLKTNVLEMLMTETQQVPVAWLLNWTLTQVIETILTSSEISRLLHFSCCFLICLEFYNSPIPCRSQIVILAVLMCIVHLVPLLIHFVLEKDSLCVNLPCTHSLTQPPNPG